MSREGTSRTGPEQLDAAGRDLLDRMPVPAVAVEVGRIVHVNVAARHLLGVEGEVPVALDSFVRRRGPVLPVWLGESQEVEVLVGPRAGSVLLAAWSTTAQRPDGAEVWVLRPALSMSELDVQSLVDPLTGLPNRSALLARLQTEVTRAERTSVGLAVLAIDLDRFHHFNDNHGHALGDELLREVADRVGRVLRAGDVLARTGGDQFMAMIRDVRQSADATAVACRVIDAIDRPYELRGAASVQTATVGVVAYEPDSAERRDPPEWSHVLVDRAEAALRRAKASGRGGWAVYDHGQQAWFDRRAELEVAMRGACERDELELVYQPVVRIETRRPDGVEALLRWRRPEGPVSPDEFIPIAETSGLVVPMGRWVLATAAAHLRRLDEEVPGPPVTMSVNLSPRQLTEPDVARDLAAIVAAAGLDARRFRLEITENALLTDLDESLATLDELTAAGFRLAIDDFGTGYSSLTYLRRFPVDTIKIDKSFVLPVNDTNADATIVSMVVALSRALGLEVVAEGVETFEHAASLYALRCDLGQGYHYSGPLDAEACLRWLRESRAVGEVGGGRPALTAEDTVESIGRLR